MRTAMRAAAYPARSEYGAGARFGERRLSLLAERAEPRY